MIEKLKKIIVKIEKKIEDLKEKINSLKLLKLLQEKIDEKDPKSFINKKKNWSKILFNLKQFIIKN